MANKITNDEFVRRLEEKAPTLKPLEKYIKNNVSIRFKCKICGTEFRNSPSNILGKRSQSCPNCYHKKQKISNSDFISRAKECNKNIEVVGEYFGSKINVKVKCIYCGKLFFMRPDSILCGRGHGSCMQKKIERKPLKSQDEFVSKLKFVNDKIVPLGIYTREKDKMLFKCLTCGKSWEARIGHVLQGDSGCPYCKISKGEQKIERYLIDNNIKYKKQFIFDDCKDIKYLPFDFYLPQYNICIEYDGEQHIRPAFGYKSFCKTILHDGMKNNYCRWNNINLIRIPHTDFNKIELILEKFIK